MRCTFLNITSKLVSIYRKMILCCCVITIAAVSLSVEWLQHLFLDEMKSSHPLFTLKLNGKCLTNESNYGIQKLQIISTFSVKQKLNFGCVLLCTTEHIGLFSCWLLIKIFTCVNTFSVLKQIHLKRGAESPFIKRIEKHFISEVLKE